MFNHVGRTGVGDWWPRTQAEAPGPGPRPPVTRPSPCMANMIKPCYNTTFEYTKVTLNHIFSVLNCIKLALKLNGRCYAFSLNFYHQGSCDHEHFPTRDVRGKFGGKTNISDWPASSEMAGKRSRTVLETPGGRNLN